MSKIHSHGGLTKQESTRLLNSLNNSFRSHLDAVHPLHAPHKLEQRHGSANYVGPNTPDDHLASLLSDSAFRDTLDAAHAARSKVETQLWLKSPIEVIQDLASSGHTDPALGALCLAAHRARLAHLSPFQLRHEIRQTQAGTKAFSWLTEGTGTLVQSRIRSTDVFTYICKLLAIQGEDRLLWPSIAHLDNSYLTLASEHITQAHLSPHGGSSVAAALAAFYRATQISSQKRPPAVLLPAVQALMHTLSGGARVPKTDAVVKHYDSLIQHTMRLNGPRYFAVASLHHPTTPNPSPALVLIRHGIRQPDFALPVVGRFFRKTVETLLDHDRRTDALFVAEIVRKSRAKTPASCKARDTLASRLEYAITVKSDMSLPSSRSHHSFAPG